MEHENHKGLTIVLGMRKKAKEDVEDTSENKFITKEEGEEGEPMEMLNTAQSSMEEFMEQCDNPKLKKRASEIMMEMEELKMAHEKGNESYSEETSDRKVNPRRLEPEKTEMMEGGRKVKMVM